MIIDCHGHFTTAPAALQAFRDAQLAGIRSDIADAARRLEAVSDDEVRASVESNQLAVLRERGSDHVLFSPKASGMEHHVEDDGLAIAWAQVSNDLVARVVDLEPDWFTGVCQLPQTPGGNLQACVAELRRCVDELGFVACNLNPDPSGGRWTGPPMTDRTWYPLYEVLVELDVPAMIHVSASCNPNFHTLGAHYLNADTSVFMQLLEGDLFRDFPDLRLILPHGGGAVPFHWGRFEGLAARIGRPPVAEHLLGNVYFDTCVYHRPGMRLLVDVVGPDNLVFASEMLGAVRGDNPDTGSGWDDTKRYLDALDLDAATAQAIFEDTPHRVYPRLRDRLSAAS